MVSIVVILRRVLDDAPDIPATAHIEYLRGTSNTCHKINPKTVVNDGGIIKSMFPRSRYRHILIEDGRGAVD